MTTGIVPSGQPERSSPPTWVVRTAVIALLLVHVALLVGVAAKYSPTGDERRHFVAGVAAWYEGRFDLYPVNSPLARLVTLAPVFVVEGGSPYSLRRGLPAEHLEQLIFHECFRDHDRFRRHLFLARCGIIPFSILGAFVCFVWARDLFGPVSGIAALTLWCFCPETLGHGSLVACDVPAAAAGVLFSYWLWRWLKTPTWYHAYVVGIALGLALLTKPTWIIGFGIGPLIIGLRLLHGPRANAWRMTGQQCFQQVLALVLLNAGYLFVGTAMPLRDYDFVSVALSGQNENRVLARQPNLMNVVHRGNRFRETIWRSLPVPLPRDFLVGLDRQKLDFESGRLWSYLRGTWSQEGWWYWYFYAFMVKTPVGVQVLALMATTLSCRNHDRQADGKELYALVIPATAIVALASAQTGFTDHFRYVLPAFPMLFVWCARPFANAFVKARAICVVSCLGLLGTVASSLSTYPHSLAFFNEVAGGPRNGHRHLIGANLDWGQDNYLVQEWIDRFPERQPIHVSQVERLWSLGKGAGADASLPKPRHDPETDFGQIRGWPQPGWHIIDVNSLHDREGGFGWALDRPAIDEIGHTQVVHFLSDQEASGIRSRLRNSTLPK